MNPKKNDISSHDDMGTTNMPTSRTEAKALNNKRYYTGKPCRHGHITYRYVAGGTCAVCAANQARRRWAAGVRPSRNNRATANKNWNASKKGVSAKEKWKVKNPKRAWAVSATGAAKQRARANGLTFELTSPYVLSITPDVCPVFGTPFIFIGGKHPTETSASLDRLVPDRGYIPGNVQVISMKANTIKNAYRSEDLEAVASWLRKMGL